MFLRLSKNQFFGFLNFWTMVLSITFALRYFTLMNSSSINSTTKSLKIKSPLFFFLIYFQRYNQHVFKNVQHSLSPWTLFQQVLKNDLLVVLKNDSNFNLWRSTDLVIFPTHLPLPLFVHYQCIFLYDTCWSVWICMFMTEKRSPWTDVN